MLAAMALTLTLQLAPAVDASSQTTHLPQTVFAEAPAKPKMRSWGWTAAGAYGFSSFGAGVGGLFAYHTGTIERSKVNLAMAIGAIICIASIPFVPIGVPVLLSSLAILIAVPSSRGAEPDHVADIELPA